MRMEWRVPITAQTGHEPGMGGRGGEFMTHAWAFLDVAIIR
jgi:hypothetical protein